jgi:hypothetical protein
MDLSAGKKASGEENINFKSHPKFLRLKLKIMILFPTYVVNHFSQLQCQKCSFALLGLPIPC